MNQSGTTGLARHNNCPVLVYNKIIKEYTIPVIKPPSLWLITATCMEIGRAELKPEKPPPRNSEIRNVYSYASIPFCLLILF
jgi:hypothetical protein